MIRSPNEHLNEPIGKEEFSVGIKKQIEKLNSFKSSSECFEFFIGETQVGLIFLTVVNELKNYPSVFIIDNQKLILDSNLKTFEERTKAVEEILIDLKKKNIFGCLKGWRNEHYFVRKSFNTLPLMSIERAAACLFGIRSYGCHINGYIKKDGQYFLWIARRSKNKPTYPNMLDNFVAGGLTAGLEVIECAKKELEEEAGLCPDLCLNLTSVDAISYAFNKDYEIHMEGEFVFDIKLPIDFVPKNQDGEVECFYLMNINQVKNAIVSDEFKINSAIVTLNFLMRKGLLTPDELPNYYEILENMHRPGL